MKEEIDWKALALRLGTLKPGEPGESGGSRYAQQAVGLLLGGDNLRKAVDHYVSGEPGFELARSVLWLIRPWSAAERCYELYRSEKEVETRRMAVVLLRDVADERALSWVDEFLEDEDAGIQGWGAGSCSTGGSLKWRIPSRWSSRRKGTRTSTFESKLHSFAGSWHVEATRGRVAR